MKRRVSVAGLVPVLAVAMTMAACSHNRSEEKQQAGQQGQQQQQQAGQSAQAQNQNAAQNQPMAQQTPGMMLGEQHVSEGQAQIERQKKVVSTVIVKDKIPTVKEQTIRADINRMSASQFTAIGFPRDVSQSIVQYRDRNGPFQSVKDLSNVEGVTQSMLSKFDGSLGVTQAQAGVSGQGQQPGQSDQSSQQSGQQSGQ